MLRSLIRSGLILGLSGCVYHELPKPLPFPADCSENPPVLILSQQIDVSNCENHDGAFEVFATAGASPYVFSIDGKNFQLRPVFADLGAGEYIVIVKDKNECRSDLTIKIESHNSDLHAMLAGASPDNSCFSNNGSVEIHVIGGNPPYSYQLNSGAPSAIESFADLGDGIHHLIVRDDLGCSFEMSFEIPRGGTFTSWINDIKPIIDSACAKSGCHAHGSGRAEFTSYEKVRPYANQIKIRTQNRSMPFDGSLSDEQILLIACWVDDGAHEN